MVPALLGKRTLTVEEPLMIMSTFDVRGLFGQPMEMKFRGRLDEGK